jgi:competence ComEA-like helix-hairpin-helix protein
MSDRPSFATRPRTPPRPPPYGAIAVVLLIGAVLMVRAWFEPEVPVGALVTVVGVVPRPGVHHLVGPLTVRAAVEAAGGAAVALPDTPIFPGDEVVVTADGVHVAPAGDPLLVGLPVDLNTAGTAALEALPGVGPALAARIVEDRAANGPFYRVEELDRVSGVGDALLRDLGPLITVGQPGDPPPPAPIDLNTASVDVLVALPGVGPTLAARIVEDRARRGPFRTVHDADRVKGIGPATIERWAGRAVVSAPN